MLNLYLHPIAPAGLTRTPYVLSTTGNVLTINGEAFDFSFMTPGSSLPHIAVHSAWIFPIDVVCDTAGDVTLHLLVPRADPSVALAPKLKPKDGSTFDYSIDPVTPLPGRA